MLKTVLIKYTNRPRLVSAHADLKRLSRAERELAYYKSALQSLADAKPGSYFYDKNVVGFAQTALAKKFRTRY